MSNSSLPLSECSVCNNTGIVGFPPDQYEGCPECLKARASHCAQAPLYSAQAEFETNMRGM